MIGTSAHIVGSLLIRSQGSVIHTFPSVLDYVLEPTPDFGMSSLHDTGKWFGGHKYTSSRLGCSMLRVLSGALQRGFRGYKFPTQ